MMFRKFIVGHLDVDVLLGKNQTKEHASMKNLLVLLMMIATISGFTACEQHNGGMSEKAKANLEAIRKYEEKFKEMIKLPTHLEFTQYAPSVYANTKIEVDGGKGKAVNGEFKNYRDIRLAIPEETSDIGFTVKVTSAGQYKTLTFYAPWGKKNSSGYLSMDLVLDENCYPQLQVPTEDGMEQIKPRELRASRAEFQPAKGCTKRNPSVKNTFASGKLSQSEDIPDLIPFEAVFISFNDPVLKGSTVQIFSKNQRLLGSLTLPNAPVTNTNIYWEPMSNKGFAAVGPFTVKITSGGGPANEFKVFGRMSRIQPLVAKNGNVNLRVWYNPDVSTVLEVSKKSYPK